MTELSSDASGCDSGFALENLAQQVELLDYGKAIRPELVNDAKICAFTDII